MWNFWWRKVEVILFELSHFIKWYVNNENMALSFVAGITRSLKVITFYLLWIEKGQGFSLIWYMIVSLNVAENMHLGGSRQQYQTKCTISTQAEKRRKLATLLWKLDHLLGLFGFGVYIACSLPSSWQPLLHHFSLGPHMLGCSLVKRNCFQVETGCYVFIMSSPLAAMYKKVRINLNNI